MSVSRIVDPDHVLVFQMLYGPPPFPVGGIQGAFKTVEVHRSISASGCLTNNSTESLTEPRRNHRVKTGAAIAVRPQNGCLVSPVFGNQYCFWFFVPDG